MDIQQAAQSNYHIHKKIVRIQHFYDDKLKSLYFQAKKQQKIASPSTSSSQRAAMSPKRKPAEKGALDEEGKSRKIKPI